MTGSPTLCFGVVYTMAMFLAVSSLSVIPVGNQDNNDPPPTAPVPPPSCCDYCDCLGVGPPGPVGPPGEAGTPGIPGIPGLHGPKGDRGYPGMDGTDGATGLKGDKGDSGDEGDQGVAGPSGVKGTKGDTGSQGSKGEPGTPYIPELLPAFLVSRTTDLQVSTDYQKIDFDMVTLNIGDDFNLKSGAFTCRVPGLYNFAFHFIPNTSLHLSNIHLMRNGIAVAWVLSNGDDHARVTASLSTILALDRDDEVFLHANSPTYVAGNQNGINNHFSGYLIQKVPEAK